MSNLLMILGIVGGVGVVIVVMVLITSLRRPTPPRGFDVLPSDETREGK